jgi:hypothetical protein
MKKKMIIKNPVIFFCLIYNKTKKKIIKMMTNNAYRGVMEDVLNYVNKENEHVNIDINKITKFSFRLCNYNIYFKELNIEGDDFRYRIISPEIFKQECKKRISDKLYMYDFDYLLDNRKTLYRMNINSGMYSRMIKNLNDEEINKLLFDLLYDGDIDYLLENIYEDEYDEEYMEELGIVKIKMYETLEDTEYILIQE